MPEPEKSPSVSLPNSNLADSKSRLLAAVGIVLRREGLAGLSLRAVAREAGVSHALPGACFGDKAGMLTAWAALAFRELGATMAASAETAADGPAALAATGQAYIRFALADPQRFELIFRQELLHRDDAELRAARSAGAQPLFDAIRRSAEEGHLSADQKRVARVTAWAMVHGLAQLAVTGQLGKPSDLEHNGLVEQITAWFASRLSGDLPRDPGTPSA